MRSVAKQHCSGSTGTGGPTSYRPGTLTTSSIVWAALGQVSASSGSREPIELVFLLLALKASKVVTAEKYTSVLLRGGYSFVQATPIWN